jgi:hypothetical protein
LEAYTTTSKTVANKKKGTSNKTSKTVADKKKGTKNQQKGMR